MRNVLAFLCAASVDCVFRVPLKKNTFFLNPKPVGSWIVLTVGEIINCILVCAMHWLSKAEEKGSAVLFSGNLTCRCV